MSLPKSIEAAACAYAKQWPQVQERIDRLLANPVLHQGQFWEKVLKAFPPDRPDLNCYLEFLLSILLCQTKLPPENRRELDANARRALKDAHTLRKDMAKLYGLDAFGDGLTGLVEPIEVDRATRTAKPATVRATALDGIDLVIRCLSGYVQRTDIFYDSDTPQAGRTGREKIDFERALSRHFQMFCGSPEDELVATAVNAVFEQGGTVGVDVCRRRHAHRKKK